MEAAQLAEGLTFAQLVRNSPPTAYRRELVVGRVVSEELRSGRITQRKGYYALTPERFEADQLVALRELRDLTDDALG